MEQEKKQKIRKLDQLSKEELQELLNTPEGIERIIELQEKSLIELKESVHNVWLQIKDKEEVAARWLGILIVLGLVQLYPFDDSATLKIFLILSLPTFAMAFYSTALSLLKHPNYLRTDFFVAEDIDKETRYHKNEAELKSLEDIYRSISNNYNRKKKFSGYIGPSVIVNFSVSIFFIIFCYIFSLKCSFCVALAIAIISIGIVYFLRIIMARGSFSFTYTQNDAGERTFSKTR